MGQHLLKPGIRLSVAEHRKLLASLKRRFRKGVHPTLMSAGLGTALRKGRPVPDRGLAVCFYVRTKLDPVPDGQRFPPTVQFRLKRKGRWRVVELPTDVISLETAAATAARVETVRDPGVPDRCTAGVVVDWTVTGQAVARTGLLTVGHAVMDPSVAGSQPTVGINGVSIGTVVAKVPASFKIDLGLIEFTNRPLFDAFGGPLRPPGPGFPSFADVDFLSHRPGKSFRPPLLGGVVEFSIAGYCQDPLTFDSHGGLLTLQHLVRVESDVANAFGPERSGSAWTQTETDAAGNVVAELLFALQVAGTPDNGYRTGYGQLLTLDSSPLVRKAFKSLQEQIGGKALRLAAFG